ncbi:type VI secretion system contractile sheath large subunit [uncultured Tateyamaria sp.]|uniref:type VI secretion system contractile sheath domain-containing protein n=2 Tax=uncultured Tateyamaria sp. TaxID=455651 RepID=UPI00345BF67A
MRNAASITQQEVVDDTDAVLSALAALDPDETSAPDPEDAIDSALADLAASGNRDETDISRSTEAVLEIDEGPSTPDFEEQVVDDSVVDLDLIEDNSDDSALDANEDDIDAADATEMSDDIAIEEGIQDDVDTVELTVEVAELTDNSDAQFDEMYSEDVEGVSDEQLDVSVDLDAEDIADGSIEDLDLSPEETTDQPDEESIESDLQEDADPAEQAEPSPHGSLDLPKPEDRDANRSTFRVAILGDFTGRASKGALEIGADLARRKPIKFDVDTLEDVIKRFATTLVLPIGQGGAGVEVTLSELDDLHPDNLYENVPLFDELSNLRRRLIAGNSTQDIAQLQEWANLFGDAKAANRTRARGATVPADLKLSAFQSLIGDNSGALRVASPAEDLIGRIVGPYVQAAPDPDQPAMLAAVDAALSGAMSAILHHPDFQAVESTWRSLELLARRITTGAGLEIVLYDISAEEWAADLASEEDLAQTGLFQMLAEEPRLDDSQGPLSAVFGLYTLEETPPHADLMARMAKISDWMNAPFLTAISDSFLETPKHERHPLVAQSWDGLRALPEASYVGLAAPRFLLRLPYGARTEPVDPFDFEEFTLRDGLKGMLWANPVVLSALLLCETVNQKGKAMKLGDVMSVGDLPLHYITDQHGDQIALPCTSRLLNTRTMAQVVARGYIPLLSIKGRTEVRQGSFQGLGAGLLAGPWGQSAGAGTGLGGVKSTLDVTREATENPGDTDDFGPSRPGGAGEDYDDQFSDDDDDDDDDLGFGSDDDDDDDDLDGFDLGGDDDADDDDEDGDDLDALLAGFGDEDDQDGDDDDDEVDPELAALMEDL